MKGRDEAATEGPNWVDGVRDRWRTEAAPSPPPPLDHVSSVLVDLTGSILQTSDRGARIALGAFVKSTVGAGVAGSAMAAVGLVGTASTGTAIASLYGAAQTTASLYWIGGLVGGGVATGGAILFVGGLGAGLYGMVRAGRSVFGSARAEETLSDEERRLLTAVAQLKSGIDIVATERRSVAASELKAFAQLGLRPLQATLREALEAGTFAHLPMYRRTRLRGQTHTLGVLADRMAKST